MTPGPPARLDRGRDELEVEDTFDAGRLDEALWIPCYLPQWASCVDRLIRFPGATPAPAAAGA